MGFRLFITEAEKRMEKGDLQDSLKAIPASHRKLLKGYSYRTQAGNTLNGSNDHIGSNDMHTKKIVVASPWNYGRGFAFLHELGHLVWAKYISTCKDRQKKWQSIIKNTKEKANQGIEELFCHAYANTYSQNKIEKHNHPAWEKFVKSLP